MIRILGLALVLATLTAVSSARADGLPVLGIDVGPTGVATSSGLAHYVTLPADGSTVVARVSTTTGDVLRSQAVPGTFTIPAVAYDGSASGLSHDGGTLVLIEPRASFPRRDTRLLVVDARTLRPRRSVHLRGDFSFDAISPGGSWIYLIEYTSSSDPTRYVVRAFDTRTGRFAERAVVDPNAPGEKMRGNPLSRVTSSDGRWAYTLYDGAGGTPFVHALDTSTRTAKCIDLTALAGNSHLWNLRLGLDQRSQVLRVVLRRSTVAAVDLRTFAPLAGGSALLRWLDRGVIAALVLAVAAGLTLLFRRRRHGTRATGLAAR